MLFFDIYNKYLKYILPASLVLFAFSECESLTFPIILVGVAYPCKSLNFFRKFDNITYGLFLYHFPIIQLLIHYGVAEYRLTEHTGHGVPTIIKKYGKEVFDITDNYIMCRIPFDSMVVGMRHKNVGLNVGLMSV